MFHTKTDLLCGFAKYAVYRFCMLTSMGEVKICYQPYSRVLPVDLDQNEFFFRKATLKFALLGADLGVQIPLVCIYHYTCAANV